MPTTSHQPHWSPTQVLNLTLHSTCIGHAKTQHRKCRNPIAYANQQEAAKILSQLSRLDPCSLINSRHLDGIMEELASRLLCKRWHQGQMWEVKERWIGDIEEFVSLSAERDRLLRMVEALERQREWLDGEVGFEGSRRRRRRERVESEVVTREVVSRRTVVRVTVEMSVRREEVESGDDDDELDEEEPRQRRIMGPDLAREEEAPLRDITIQRPEDSSSPSSSSNEQTIPTPTASLQENTTAIRAEAEDQRTEQEQRQENLTAIGAEAEDQRSGQDQEQENTTATRTEAEAQAQSPSQSQSAANNPQPSPPPSSTATTPAHQPQQEPTPSTHPSRRAIEGDCSICHEDLGTDDGDITWCRAQCRQNFHTECISLWHALQEADRRAKTCPYCRTGWAE